MHFSSVINLTIPQDVSCCVFGSAVDCISIQNVKNISTLYFTLLLNSVPRYNHMLYLGSLYFSRSSVSSNQI
jgi:hypothetical protein